ncbi:MAG: hypothetical protein FWB90_03490 [Fibromonadales bacterium]|nr:hypothetical protein [Fibromonadales bacterium]
MNRKILSFALVSATFLFGCSADGLLQSSSAPPEWDSGLSSSPGKSGGAGSGGGSSACYIDIGDIEMCATPVTVSECNSIADDIGYRASVGSRSSCPSGYNISCTEYDRDLGKTITIYYYGYDAPDSCY